jgi:S-sulfosulfanyl-L-cysteine sulfohydrolase
MHYFKIDAEQKNIMQLSIAYLNDVHGYLEPHQELFDKDEKEVLATAGGYARIATAVNNIRNSNEYTLLFDGGDTFHGTLPVVQSKGEALLAILNKLGFTAMVGHWDFAYGPVQVNKLAEALNYPMLGINVFKEDGSLFLPPYIITEVENTKIAIIGICSNIIDKTMPDNFSEGLKITDGMKELPLMIEQVKQEGAHLIMLLSHNGFPQDAAMVSEIPGIDICLSAHTHNRLYEPAKIKETIIIQCGCHGSFLGHLTLNIEQHKIVDYKYELITIDETIEPDAAIEQMVEAIMQPYQYLKEEILGTTDTMLHRYHTLESTMDDLLLASIQSIGDAEIAFSNGWRYGAPVAAGNISKWDLYNIIPMNPVVSTVEITGAEIIQMLKENLERTFSADAMKQMGGYIKRCSGLQVKMRIENPTGHRIQQIFISGLPLIKEKTYKAAFVTLQGVPKKLGKNRQDLSIHAVEAMSKYLSSAPHYTARANHSFSLV